MFDCPRELAKERVVNRNLGRPMDTPEIFDQRYEAYLDKNPDIADYYSRPGNEKLVEVSR